jgi:hypothetical protein
MRRHKHKYLIKKNVNMLAIFKTIFGKEININIHIKKENEHLTGEREAFPEREIESFFGKGEIFQRERSVSGEGYIFR